MLGSCVPDAVGPVVIVTELGAPLDTVQLLQLSWESRLNVSVFLYFYSLLLLTMVTTSYEYLDLVFYYLPLQLV